MTCVECGAKAEFWLCSNACALAYAEKRKRMKCAICSFNPKTGRIGRHDTNKICEACRSRPENAGWVVAESEEPDDSIELRLGEMERLKEQQDKPLSDITPLTQQIARMIIDGERVAKTFRDGQGRQRVKYRWRAYTVRRLAKELGCTRKVVQRVIASVE